MVPIINSISPEKLFDSGSIVVEGENLNSNRTILLVNGIESEILYISNNKISAVIPRVFESGTYDVRIITRYSTSISQVYISDPYFVDIRSISDRNYDLRQTPVVIPNEDGLLVSESTLSSSSSLSSLSSLSSSTDSSSSTSTSSSSSTSTSSSSSTSTSSSSSTSTSSSSTSSTSDSSMSSISSISSNSTSSSKSTSSTSPSSLSLSSLSTSSSTSSTTPSSQSLSSLSSTSVTSASTQSFISSDSSITTSSQSMISESTSSSTSSTTPSSESIQSESTSSSTSSTTPSSQSLQSDVSSESSDPVLATLSYSYGGQGYTGAGTDTQEFNSNTNSWTGKTTMINTARYWHTGSSIDTKCYAYIGHTNTPSSQNYSQLCEEYNPSTNSWLGRPNIIAPGRSFAASTGINSKGYVFGGDDGPTAEISDNDEFNPSTGTWSSKSSILGASRSALEATTSGGLGYVFGGRSVAFSTYSFYTTHSEYNSTTNGWNSKVGTAPARSDCAYASVGSKIYLACGKTSETTSSITVTNDSKEYSSTTNSWSSITNVFTSRHKVTGAGTLSKFQIFGGRSGSTNFDDVDEYDPSNLSWTTKANYPVGAFTGVFEHQTAAV